MAGSQPQEQAQPAEQRATQALERPTDGEESDNNETNAQEEAAIVSETEGELQNLKLTSQQTKQSHGHLAKQRESLSNSMVAINRFAKRLLNGLILLPMDLTLNLSRGFHNAPKLYHDRMVKTNRKVVGMRSGLKAAGGVWSRLVPFI